MRWMWALMILLGLGATAQAAPRAERPTAAVPMAGCVTPECHSQIKSAKIIHGPVGVNACDACHDIKDVAKHTFTLKRPKAELCTYCHEFSMKGLPVVHKPVQEGECLGCHDPHGGRSKSLVREASIAALCARCHDAAAMQKKFPHGPVKEGACDSCHPPHGAKFAKLLDVRGTDLCLACHQEFEPAIAGAKERHKALEQGCEKCHDAHGSNEPMGLIKATNELCLGCHKKFGEKMAKVTVPHSAVTSGRGCMNCHSAHASNVGKMLAASSATGCLKCHDKPVKREGRKDVPAVSEVADAKLVRHGEIKDGQCAGCHDVHGGQRDDLLVKGYSQAVYQKFSPDNAALCFKCHELGLAQAEKTTKATAFRNGDKNLHFVHANSGTHDKNCNGCHVSHASAGSRLVRTSLQYGKWDMPLKFVKTATGGNCTPGCHTTWGYDREKPVTTAPASTRPTVVEAATRRAERDDTRMVRWSAKDISGAAVELPDPENRLTVLVVVGENPLPMIEEVRQAVVGVKSPAKVVVIVSGDKAAQRAAEIKTKTSWAVVSDPDQAAATALEVRGWPLALVLRGDGLELARVSGSLMALKLTGYLGGEEPATRPAEADAAQMAARDVRVARALLDDGRSEQALAFLERSGAGKSGEGLALRAAALIELKRFADAAPLVQQLSADKAMTAQAGLLQGRLLIAQEKWDEARDALEACVKTPAPAEAHRLLGSVYAHEKNWEKAAEEYRLALTPGK